MPVFSNTSRIRLMLRFLFFS
jgi:hypothetical protein